MCLAPLLSLLLAPAFAADAHLPATPPLHRPPSPARLAPPLDDVRASTTAALRNALVAAKPGTRILVAPGDYDGFLVSGVQGAAGRPIVLAAASADSPPVI